MLRPVLARVVAVLPMQYRVTPVLSLEHFTLRFEVLIVWRKQLVGRLCQIMANHVSEHDRHHQIESRKTKPSRRGL